MARTLNASRSKLIKILSDSPAVTSICTYSRVGLDISSCRKVKFGQVVSSKQDTKPSSLSLLTTSAGKMRKLVLSLGHDVSAFTSVAHNIFVSDKLYYSDDAVATLTKQLIRVKPYTTIIVDSQTFENNTASTKTFILPSLSLNKSHTVKVYSKSSAEGTLSESSTAVLALDITDFYSEHPYAIFPAPSSISASRGLPPFIGLTLHSVKILGSILENAVGCTSFCLSTPCPTLEQMTRTFKNNTSLVSISFEDFDFSNLKAFDEPFLGCTNLQSLTGFNFNMIGDGYKSRGCMQLFKGCSSLRFIDLTKSTINTYLVDEMFAGCTNLTRVKLPFMGKDEDSLTHLYGRNIFKGCTHLEDVWMHLADVCNIGFEDTLINRYSIVRLLSCLAHSQGSYACLYFNSNIRTRIQDFDVLAYMFHQKGVTIFIDNSPVSFEADIFEIQTIITSEIPLYSTLGYDLLAFISNEPIKSFQPRESVASHTYEELSEFVVPEALTKAISPYIHMIVSERIPSELQPDDDSMFDPSGLEIATFGGTADGEDEF